jgi:hypothetical protein
MEKGHYYYKSTVYKCHILLCFFRSLIRHIVFIPQKWLNFFYGRLHNQPEWKIPL